LNTTLASAGELEAISEIAFYESLAVRGGHLQLDHGWNCAQSTTDGYNQCVKLAAVQM